MTVLASVFGSVMMLCLGMFAICVAALRSSGELRPRPWIFILEWLVLALLAWGLMIVSLAAG